MAQMSTPVGVTPDREWVTTALLEDGKQLSWIEFNPEQCDHFHAALTLNFHSKIKTPQLVVFLDPA
jgi:hypothetical protein